MRSALFNEPLRDLNSLPESKGLGVGLSGTGRGADIEHQ